MTFTDALTISIADHTKLGKAKAPVKTIATPEHTTPPALVSPLRI
jgi:hypothetical protein